MSAWSLRDELFKLSAAERILLAQDLWDSIAEDPDAWELTDEQRSELVQRLDRQRLTPGEGRSWSATRAWITRRDER